MTHTYTLKFEKSIISASCVHGPRTQCKRGIHKCYEFSIKNQENKTEENVPLVPATRQCLPWLFGPASSLITRSIIYPCTKYRCSLPCLCLICQKNPPTCSVPASEACHCQNCQCHFDNHGLYHAAYHLGCKFCDQMVLAMPQLNFYLIFNSSEKFRKSDRTYHGYFSGGALDSERSGVILHPGQKMKWDEWRERYNNWLAGTTDEDEIWCPGCPTLFFSYDLLRKHMTTEHTVSKSFRHYYTGVAAVVPKDFSCDQCGSKFTKSSDLQRHVDSIHIMQEYIRCELCAMKFSRWDSYKRHKLRIHDSSEKNICGNCGMKYESAGALMKHIGRKCSSSLTCEKCASKFSRTSDLKRHQKSTIVITCDICGQKVCNGKVLKEHVKSEHGDSVKNFSCGICGQSFTLKKSLDLHVKKSVFIPCYDCGDILCNKRAYNMHSYNIHGKKL